MQVFRALYPYEAQTPEEASISENELLIISENTDPDWSTVYKRGLVPSTYIERAAVITTMNALYDYSPQTDEEVELFEGDVVEIFDTSDSEWYVVKSRGNCGLAPSNYLGDSSDVQDAVDEDEEEVIQSSPQDTQRQKAALLNLLPPVTTSVPSLSWTAATRINNKKKQKGWIGIDDEYMLFFVSQKKDEVIDTAKCKDIAAVSEKKKKVVITLPSGSWELEVDKQNLQSVMKMLDDARTRSKISAPIHVQQMDLLPTQAAAISNSPSLQKMPSPRVSATSPQLKEPEVIRSVQQPQPQPQQPVKLVHPPQIQQQSPPKIAFALYDYTALTDEELSIKENDNLIVLDESDPDWWMVKKVSRGGAQGLVPKTYVELKQRLVEDEKSVPVSVEEVREEKPEVRNRPAREPIREYARELEREVRETPQRPMIPQRPAEIPEIPNRPKFPSREPEDRPRLPSREPDDRPKLPSREPEDRPRLPVRESEERPRLPGRPDDKPPLPARSPSPPPIRPSLPTRTDKESPNPSKLREWTDKTGTFKVHAEIIGVSEGKVQLFKSNGVKIGVPLEKLSEADKRYLRDSGFIPKNDSSIGTMGTGMATGGGILKPTVVEHLPTSYNGHDWLKFFKNAGIEDSEARLYAQTFSKEKLDGSHLGDLTREVCKELGVKEGDYFKLKKVIPSSGETLKGVGVGLKNNEWAHLSEQLERHESHLLDSNLKKLKEREKERQEKEDEEFARKLQEEENRGGSGVGRRVSGKKVDKDTLLSAKEKLQNASGPVSQSSIGSAKKVVNNDPWKPQGVTQSNSSSPFVSQSATTKQTVTAPVGPSPFNTPAITTLGLGTTTLSTPGLNPLGSSGLGSLGTQGLNTLATPNLNTLTTPGLNTLTPGLLPLGIQIQQTPPPIPSLALKPVGLPPPLIPTPNLQLNMSTVGAPAKPMQLGLQNNAMGTLGTQNSLQFNPMGIQANSLQNTTMQNQSVLNNSLSNPLQSNTLQTMQNTSIGMQSNPLQSLQNKPLGMQSNTMMNTQPLTMPSLQSNPMMNSQPNSMQGMQSNLMQNTLNNPIQNLQNNQMSSVASSVPSSMTSGYNTLLPPPSSGGGFSSIGNASGMGGQSMQGMQQMGMGGMQTGIGGQGLYGSKPSWQAATPANPFPKPGQSDPYAPLKDLNNNRIGLMQPGVSTLPQPQIINQGFQGGFNTMGQSGISMGQQMSQPLGQQMGQQGMGMGMGMSQPLGGMGQQQQPLGQQFPNQSFMNGGAYQGGYR